MVRELTAVYWDRRFDAFDPELVAPFWALKDMTQKKISRKAAKKCKDNKGDLRFSFASLRETASNRMLQCVRTVHGPT